MDLDSPTWETELGAAGGAGSVTTKQERARSVTSSRSQSQETPSVTPAPSLPIFVQVLRLEQPLPPQPWQGL